MIAAQTGSRERLLDAAAALLADSPGQPLSVRAICTRADVQLPTLYHYFGNKQGLLDALIRRSFGAFTERLRAAHRPDPLDALRGVWWAHIEEARERPATYALLYGSATPQSQLPGSDGPLRIVEGCATSAAAAGALRVSAPEATWRIQSSAVGAALATIGDADAPPAWTEAACAAVIASVLRTDAPAPSQSTVAMHAGALHAALSDASAATLAMEERMLLERWLRILSQDD